LLCTITIFATVPVARSIQQFVYSTVGREFFTYAVLCIIGAGLATLLYLFIFKLKVKKVSQYIGLFICAGLYVYFTFQLREHPEEAVHFIEYGLLSYFLFKALSHRIRDWTVYLTAVLFVLLVGTTDEFMQWLMPRRYWSFKDVGLNMLSGGIFLFALWKGIKPKIICKPVKRFSVRMLIGVMTIDLIFLGLCLTNTPEAVNRYTAGLRTLSWLKNEEPMAEFGYKHKDLEIGVFYSRLSLEELKKMDFTKGEAFGRTLSQEISSGKTQEELIAFYNRYTNPFLYEFLIHLFERDSNLDKLTKIDDAGRKIIMSNAAFKENLLIEKYFKNTLKHSGFVLPDEKVNALRRTTYLWEGKYVSKPYSFMITSFSLKTAWVVIIILLITIWAAFRKISPTR